MNIKKGDRFVHISGDKCFISQVTKTTIRISYVNSVNTTQIWDRNEFIEACKTSVFVPFTMPKVNRETMVMHLVEYQLNIVGKHLSCTEEDGWYNKYTMTTQEHELLKWYAIPLIKKIYKCSKKKAEETFKWFDFQYGLRIKEKTTENE
jgi:hypothetical protein